MLVSRLAPAHYATEAFTWSSTFIVRGLGARVWDEQGREYIDCVGGNGHVIAYNAVMSDKCAGVYMNKITNFRTK